MTHHKYLELPTTINCNQIEWNCGKKSFSFEGANHCLRGRAYGCGYREVWIDLFDNASRNNFLWYLYLKEISISFYIFGFNGWRQLRRWYYIFLHLIIFSVQLCTFSCNKKISNNVQISPSSAVDFSHLGVTSGVNWAWGTTIMSSNPAVSRFLWFIIIIDHFDE